MSSTAEFVARQIDDAPDPLSILRRAAARHRDRTAVLYLREPGDLTPVQLTYGDLLDEAEGVAARLHALGVAADSAAAILAPATPGALAAFIGASAAGVAFPLNPLLTADAMATQLRLARTRAVIALGRSPSVDLRERLDAGLAAMGERPPVIEIDPQTGRVGGVAAPPGRFAQAEPVRCAALFHTGGTTGAPKLAMLSARGVAAGAFISAAAIGWRETDRLFIALPLFHVGGAITSALAALAAGATVIFCGLLGARDPDLQRELWTIMGRVGASVLVAVPTTLAAASASPVEGVGASALRAIATGATAIPPELASRVEQRVGRPVREIFGMTEMSGICTAQRLDEARGPRSVGMAGPLVDVRVVDGEVQVRGPNRFLGYLTQEGVVGRPDDWIPTGDLGWLDRDRALHLTGRRKDVIIRGGHNIDPQMIEAAACAYPGVEAAGAVGMPDAHAGEVPVLFVKLRAGASDDLEPLRAHLVATIAERPAMPRRIVAMPELPLTPIGKVARFRLRQKACEDRITAALEELPVRAVVCTDETARRVRIAWVRPPTASETATAAKVVQELGVELASADDQAEGS